MIRGDLVIMLPNPHNKEIGIDLLSRILKQADIKKQEAEMISYKINSESFAPGHIDARELIFTFDKFSM